jgi:hypothetical protein
LPLASGLASALVSFTAAAATPSLRLDLHHTGGRGVDIYAVDRVVVEPLPWPGHPDRAVDAGDFGGYRFEVRDAATGRVLHARGYDSIFAEWVSTAEAETQHRTFHESLRFAMPAGPVDVVVQRRNDEQAFVTVWQTRVDPADPFVERAPPPAQSLVTIERNGEPADKVDLLLLGDGYTAAEMDKWHADARRLADILFAASPFKERRTDFNVWAIDTPAAESGVSRPLEGIRRRSPIGAQYDAFGSERYILAFDNRRLRDVAGAAPYEAVEIVVNGRKYGGGGIFNSQATVASDNAFTPYVFVHEFGHHFAGLADEYYGSPVAYAPQDARPEPWEPNATADPKAAKWSTLVAEGTALPTPWPKAEYEVLSKEIQERRRKIRAENRPEAEMEALFREETARSAPLLDRPPLGGTVGAFEGAMYEAAGYYRPQTDCIMFTRNPVPFCAVCRRAIERVIDLYAAPAPPEPAPSRNR